MKHAYNTLSFNVLKSHIFGDLWLSISRSRGLSIALQNNRILLKQRCLMEKRDVCKSKCSRYNGNTFAKNVKHPPPRLLELFNARRENTFLLFQNITQGGKTLISLLRFLNMQICDGEN